MIFHRVTFGRRSEVVIFEPIEREFHWLSMYIEPSSRGRDRAEMAFLFCVRQLHGRHLIHCSMSISSFATLARKYRWKKIGPSNFITGCDEFHYVSRGRVPEPRPSFNAQHQRIDRTPKLRYFNSQSDVRGIVKDILAAYANS